MTFILTTKATYLSDLNFLDLPLGLTISDIASMCSLMLSKKSCGLYYLRFVTIPCGVDGGRGGGKLPSNRPNGNVPLDGVAFFIQRGDRK